MRQRILFGFLIILLSFFIAFPAFGNYDRDRDHPNKDKGGAVFIMTNSDEGNVILMYQRSSSGRITYADFFPTGGRGVGVGKTVAIDPLGSQNSLIMSKDGMYLYAVNAGDDTITAFQVYKNYLKFLDIVPSGGRFPVSLTVHGETLYVLNAGASDGVNSTPANITGFRMTGYQLSPLENSTRDLIVVPQNPSDSESDFPNILATPAQVQFTPQANQLVVTIKDGVNAINNSIWVFPVEKDDDYRPSDTPSIFPTSGPVPFGFTFDFFGRLFVTDAAAGTLTSYRVEDDSVEMIGDGPAETGQMATCWIVATRPYSRYVYAANTGSGTLSAYRVKFDGTLSPVGLFTVKDGALNIDTAISRDGRYLYTQNGGLGTVSIFRVRRGGALELLEEVEVTEPVSGFQGIVAW